MGGDCVHKNMAVPLEYSKFFDVKKKVIFSLKLGKGIFIRTDDINMKLNFRTNLCGHGKALGMKFKTKSEPGGFRVWRVK